MNAFAFAENRRPLPSRQAGNWELRIGFTHVILLWALLAAAMLAVFIFGFHKGRSQGLAVAFEEYSEQTVRLPVVQPVANEQAAAELIPEQIAKTEPKAAAAEKSGLKEPEFDFSAKKAVVGTPSLTGDPAESQAEMIPAPKALAGGAATKASLELFSEPLAGNKLDAGSEKAPGKRLVFIEGQRRAAPSPSPAVEPPAAKTESAAQKNTAPKTALPEKKTASAPTIPAGWYIQAAATQTLGDASVLIRRLQASGNTAVLERAQIRDKMYYRVLVGPFVEREKAMQIKEEITAARNVAGVPFIKFVNNSAQ